MRHRVPGIVWLIVGLAASAMAAPTVVSAATAQLVAIQNATFTAAHQLTTTEIAPANFRQYDISSPAGIGGCQTLTTLPATSGLVVTELRAAWTQEGSGVPLRFYAGANCTGTLIGSLAASWVQYGNDSTTIETTLDPGFAVPAGTTVSVQTTQGSSAFVGDLYLDGYSVPAADVPHVG